MINIKAQLMEHDATYVQSLLTTQFHVVIQYSYILFSSPLYITD